MMLTKEEIDQICGDTYSKVSRVSQLTSEILSIDRRIDYWVPNGSTNEEFRRNYINSLKDIIRLCKDTILDLTAQELK